MKVLEENIGVSLCDVDLGKPFLGMAARWYDLCCGDNENILKWIVVIVAKLSDLLLHKC